MGVICPVCDVSSKINKGKRSANRFKVSFYSLSIDQFLDRNIIDDGLYQILIGGNAIDVLIKRGITFSDKALLTFNGALSEKARELDLIPNFTGVALAEEIGASVVAFFDPVIYLKDDIYIGWYLGWRELNTQKTIILIVNHLAKVMGVSFCSFGGSGGGFASLYYLSESDEINKAFVWNCQTVVEKYNSRFWRHLSEVSLQKKLTSEVEFSEEMGAIGICTSLLSKSDSLKNKDFIYLQNALDWHTTVHAEPFIKKLDLDDEDGFFYSKEKMLFFKGNWGAGHAVPPRKLIVSALKLYLADNVAGLRREVSKYKYIAGENKIVKKEEDPGFYVSKKPKGLLIEVVDDFSIWATIYEKWDGVVVKKYQYNKEKKFFINCESGFEGLSVVLFSKYIDGSVAWREISNQDIMDSF